MVRDTINDTYAATRCGAYARYSSDLQQDSSIDDQFRKLSAKAASFGHCFAPELLFCDRAVSGALDNRDGLNQMLIAASEGKLSVLYTESLSRLARNGLLSQKVLRTLVGRHKVRVISVDDGVDTIVEGWEYSAAFHGIQNEQFLRNLGKHVHRGQTGTLFSGFSVGDLTYGYTSVPANDSFENSRRHARPKMHYAINESEADIVRLVFDKYSIEQWTQRQIVLHLNNIKAPKGRKSTKTCWHPDLIRRMLSNRKYVGIWEWGRLQNERDLITGKTKQVARQEKEFETWTRVMPQLRIVDDEVFGAAQCRLAENRRRFEKIRNEKGRLTGSCADVQGTRARHLLSGLIICHECGARFVAGGGKRKYMFCPQYKTGQCSVKTTLNRDLAEPAIITTISRLILSDDSYLATLVTDINLQYESLKSQGPKEVETLRQDFDKIVGKMQRLLTALEDGEVEEIRTRFTELRSRREDLQRRIREVESSVSRATRNVTVDWVHAQLSKLGELIRENGESAAVALRAVLADKIVAKEIRQPNGQRHHLSLTFAVRLDRAIMANETSSSGLGSVVKEHELRVELPIRNARDYELVAEHAIKLFDQGETIEAIANEIGHCNAVARDAVMFAFQLRGEPVLDLRSRKCRVYRKSKRYALKLLAEQIWNSNEPLCDVARRHKCSIHLLRKAIVQWHNESGVPIPDGRTRRKRNRLRQQASNDINGSVPSTP